MSARRLHPRQQRELLAHDSPLIIIGAHRSGTSMMTRLLSRLGIYMGWRLSNNAESLFFQNLNRKLLRRAGGSWIDVKPLVEALQSPEYVQQEADRLNHQMFGFPGIAEYFGLQRWLNGIRTEQFQTWGWKDPRNSLTLPVLMQVFPQARVLHIVRNGIDAAISLHRREKWRKRHKWYNKDYRNYQRLSRNHSTDYDELRFCFQLWEHYVEAALAYRPLMPSTSYYEVRYEDLLTAPVKSIEAILSWLNYSIDPAALQDVCSMVDAKRLDNREYARPYWQVIPKLSQSPLMQQLGYDYPLEV